MSQTPNPIQSALIARGISLPDQPVDLSPTILGLGIQRQYVISMTGRCGSTWLATTLGQIPFCGNPLEYLSEEAIPHYGHPDGSGAFTQYFASIIAAKRTGAAFGFKIDANRLGWLSQICNIGASFSPAFTAWIDMRRLNIVKQAFSFARARQSGVWHVYADKDVGGALPPAEPIADQTIWSDIRAILQAEALAEQMYRQYGIQPLRIVYEQLLDSKSQLVWQVLAHLFPKRSFPADLALSDGTQRLSVQPRNAPEDAFCMRFSKQINLVSAHRQGDGGDLAQIMSLIDDITR